MKDELSSLIRWRNEITVRVLNELENLIGDGNTPEEEMAYRAYQTVARIMMSDVDDWPEDTTRLALQEKNVYDENEALRIECARLRTELQSPHRQP